MARGAGPAEAQQKAYALIQNTVHARLLCCLTSIISGCWVVQSAHDPLRLSDEALQTGRNGSTLAGGKPGQAWGRLCFDPDVEREYGCGGGAIAAEIAQRLGWRLWDHPSPKRSPSSPMSIAAR